MERAVRFELTLPGLQSGAWPLGDARARGAQTSVCDDLNYRDCKSESQTEVCATRFGTEGEIRTLESSLEDSHVSGYITSAKTLPIAN